MREYVLKNQKMLRRGFTTGTCAAAAAAAAVQELLYGIRKESVDITVPGGETLSIRTERVPDGGSAVHSEADSARNACTYSVKKDSGDDPDVTNGTEIRATVSYVAESELPEFCFQDEVYINLYLDGGEGVGRVTKPGLEQNVGFAAINKVPRRMIFDAVGGSIFETEMKRPILITIEVPCGRELAQRTFNPMLGIEGGISILGTSGIVDPMSEKAILDTIEIQMKMLKANGAKTALLIPGNYGRKYAGERLGLDTEQAVETSNFLGETFDLAVSLEFEKMLLIGNFGKLVKLAAGIMNTHSKYADGRAEIIGVHAALAGANAAQVKTLMECITTDEMLKFLKEWGLDKAVVDSILRKIEHHVGRRVHGAIDFGVIIFSEKYGLLGETGRAEEIMRSLPNRPYDSR